MHVQTKNSELFIVEPIFINSWNKQTTKIEEVVVMVVWKPHQLDISLSLFIFLCQGREFPQFKKVQTRRFNFVWNLFSLRFLVIVMHLVHLQRFLSWVVCVCVYVYVYMCFGCRKNLIKVQVVAHCSGGMTYVHVWIWILDRKRFGWLLATR